MGDINRSVTCKSREVILPLYGNGESSISSSEHGNLRQTWTNTFESWEAENFSLPRETGDLKKDLVSQNYTMML